MENNEKIVKILPPIKRYMNKVEHKLNLPTKVKNRVMSDFITSVIARNEAGESYEDIMASLGSPSKVAAELNEQMKEFAYRKSPWRFACLAASILAALWIIFAVIGPLGFSMASSSVGIIGGADGPTAIFVTTSPAGWPDAFIAAAIIIGGIAGFVKLGKLKNN